MMEKTLFCILFPPFAEGLCPPSQHPSRPSLSPSLSLSSSFRCPRIQTAGRLVSDRARPPPSLICFPVFGCCSPRLSGADSFERSHPMLSLCWINIVGIDLLFLLVCNYVHSRYLCSIRWQAMAANLRWTVLSHTCAVPSIGLICTLGIAGPFSISSPPLALTVRPVPSTFGPSALPRSLAAPSPSPAVINQSRRRSPDLPAKKKENDR